MASGQLLDFKQDMMKIMMVDKVRVYTSMILEFIKYQVEAIHPHMD